MHDADFQGVTDNIHTAGHSAPIGSLTVHVTGGFGSGRLLPPLLLWDSWYQRLWPFFSFSNTGVSAIPALAIRSPPFWCFILVFSDSKICLSVYFQGVFPILDRLRTKPDQNCQINVKMSTYNLTKIAKSVILETFFGLEVNK